MDRRAGAFARLFEAVHEGVYIGTIGPEMSATIAANPHLKLIFGYPGDVPEADVRPFDRDRFVDPQARVALVERLTTDGSVYDYLLRLRRIDGTPVWVELTARADPPDERSDIRLEALVRDVSERKRLDDETRDLYHQLLQAEKMAALGQTISGVAHELNNPLATILSSAERLSQRPALEDPVRRGLETILSESERAARIVRHLLTFARKRQTTRAMVDVNQIVRETLALRAYLFLGVIEAVAAMAAFFFVLRAAGWTYGQTMAPDDPVYLSATTACLSAIIVMQIVNVFLCRSTVRSVASTGIFDNRLILWGVCLEIVLLMAINYTPFGNFLLGTAPVPGQLWLFMVPFAVAMLGLEETRKWLVRRTLQHGAQMRQLWTA